MKVVSTRGRKSIAFVASFLVSQVLLIFFQLSLPSPLFNDPYSAILESRDGRLMAARIAADEQWRFPSKFQVPEKYKIAVTEYEDRRFYNHFGVDFLAMGRALIQNTSSQKIESGASTITMQLIRLMRKNPDRSLLEKITEAFLALRVEISYSKDMILALYASHAPFGGNIVGIEAASFRLFGRQPENLSWAETCLLAVLPNSPGLVHLEKNRTLLKEKRDILLKRLFVKGAISVEAYESSLLEELPTLTLKLPNLASHYIDGLDTGTRTRSTIDYEIEQNLESVIERHHEILKGNGVYNAAILVLRQEDLSVAAYIGNIPSLGLQQSQSEHGGDNDLILANRSTGSLLKPFLYAALLEDGQLTPEALISDIPTRYGAYSPENNVKGYSGTVHANEALYRSLNIPAARELRQFGIDRFYSLLKDLGMTSLWRPAQEYGIPLILGGAEGNLFELTKMYGVLGQVAMGQRPEDYPFSSSVAYQTLDVLSNVVRPEEEGDWTIFKSSRKISFKTGTSFGYRDAWSIGLDGKWVVGVWVGNASGGARPDLRGIMAAAPLLFDSLSSLDAGSWFTKPSSGFYETEICLDSGYIAGPNCTRKASKEIPISRELPKVCPYCNLLHLDPKSGKLADPKKINPFDMKHEKRFILPPNLELWYKPNHPEYKGFPEDFDLSINANISILNPEFGSQIYIPIDLDGSPGKLVTHAAHNDSRALLFWNLDDIYLGATNFPHQLEIRPSRGQHLLSVTDQNGNSKSVLFEILSK